MSHYILASPLLPLHQRIPHREPWYNAFLQKGVMCKEVFNDTSKFSSHKYRKEGRLVNKEKRKEGRKSCFCILLITIFNPSRLRFYGFCPNEAIHNVSNWIYDCKNKQMLCYRPDKQSCSGEDFSFYTWFSFILCLVHVPLYVYWSEDYCVHHS